MQQRICRAIVAAYAAVILSAACYPLAAQEARASFEGQAVAAVRVVTESGDVLEENPARVSIQRGEPYDSGVIRESLKQLYASGRFADVRVEAREVTGGVRLDFVVQRNFFINVVRVTGLQEPPSESAALGALRLGLGHVFRENVMPEALDRLREALVEQGQYQARMDYELTPHPTTRQMDITVHVTPGPRARMGVIEVRNQTSFPDEELLRKSKLRPGLTVKTSRLESATSRVRKFLVKKSYLGARATVRRGDYDAQANTVPLALEISAGPRVRVEVTGAKISSGDLRKLLPIYQEGTVDEDLLQEGRRNIRDFLERDGYFDSDVRYTVEDDPENGQRVITYQIERGPRRRLVGVAFEGNQYFGDELLRDRVRILPAGLLSHGRFSRRLLRDDEDSLRSLYLANGFREVQVESELVQDYQGKEGDLFVRFRIAEGEQTRVEELHLEGNQNLSDDFLLSVVGSSPGQPYSEFNVAGDRDNILALYFNEGFPEARFDSQVEEGSDAHRVRLTYRILEGSQITVEDVLIGGYEYTKPGVIRREVQVQAGQPLREGELVETQRRLYNLGIFSRVNIAPQNPEGTDPTKTLLVQVEEAKRYTLAYGGGIEVQRLGGGDDPVSGEFRASPRALFEITRGNFLGRAHTVAFKVRTSTLQSRALLSYNAPNYFGRPNFNLLLTGFADRTTDIRTFSSTRYEANAQLEHRVSSFDSFLYRYSFRRVLVDPDSLKVSRDQIPLFSQPTKISALGITWIRERRNDPADASRGSFNTVDLSVAAREMGSSASFIRFFAQNSTFHPIGRQLVFARSTRVGIQETLGETTPFDIPLPERFFAGGGNSLRGFGLNQAGPRDPQTGFPLGGQVMLIFNQELRFPMRLPFVGTQLGGALFYDAGGIFARANRITLRASPPSPTDLNYFTHTIGFGFRYATPIGPVRLDLGYLLNSARFEFCTDSTTPDVPRCPAGQAVTSSRLPRFQFFFNIGSIF